jgi:hypothetical protein
LPEGYNARDSFGVDGMVEEKEGTEGFPLPACERIPLRTSDIWTGEPPLIISTSFFILIEKTDR